MVVTARAKKMGIEAIYGIGIQEKGHALREILLEKNVNAENVVYV